MILHDTESEEFNLPAVGIRLESMIGIILSPTTGTFSSTSNVAGATGIIAEFLLRSPLNSTVCTRRDESPTSITGTGTSITSRRLVTSLGMKSATADILCRKSRMDREGDNETSVSGYL